jgi:hypothetical protein
MNFGRLTVIERNGSDKRGKAYWTCLCSCGGKTLKTTNGLLSGDNKSCGCLKTGDHTTHGLSKTREYRIWQGIKERCLNPKRREYKWYGGRGIKICDRWMEFENFIADMGKSPENYTVDRKDVNKGYDPENCIWIPFKKQGWNTRKTIRVKDGAEIISMREWAKRNNVDRKKVRDFVKGGLSLEDAMKKVLGEKNG